MGAFAGGSDWSSSSVAFATSTPPLMAKQPVVAQPQSSAPVAHSDTSQGSSLGAPLTSNASQFQSSLHLSSNLTAHSSNAGQTSSLLSAHSSTAAASVPQTSPDILSLAQPSSSISTLQPQTGTSAASTISSVSPQPTPLSAQPPGSAVAPVSQSSSKPASSTGRWQFQVLGESMSVTKDSFSSASILL